MSLPVASPPRRLGVLLETPPGLFDVAVSEELAGLQRLGVPLSTYAVASLPQSWLRQPLVLAASHLQLLASSPWRYLRAISLAAARGRRGWRQVGRAGWLAAQLQREDVSHLHAHGIAAPADVAELASVFGGLAFSIATHDSDIYLSRPADLNRKLHAARFTVTGSDFNLRVLRRLAPSATVLRLYRGVDLAAYRPRPPIAAGAPPTLLAVGRLVEKKGLDTLIDACRLLRGRGLAVHCRIVGEGPERDRLAAQIEQHALGEWVQLLGTLERERLREQFSQATAFALPSRVAADGDRDGLPRVLLEAMALGLPVVASRVSGIPELVRHRVNGMLVAAEDPAALADALQQLIESPALAVQLGQGARLTMQRDFDSERHLRALLGLLEASRALQPQPLPA